MSAWSLTTLILCQRSRAEIVVDFADTSGSDCRWSRGRESSPTTSHRMAASHAAVLQLCEECLVGYGLPGVVCYGSLLGADNLVDVHPDARGHVA